MKRTFMTTAFGCGLAFLLCSVGQPARSSAHAAGGSRNDLLADKGGGNGSKAKATKANGSKGGGSHSNKGGGKSPAGGGAKSQPPSAKPAQQSGRGKAQHSGRKSVKRTPADTGPRHTPGKGAQQRGSKHTPSSNNPKRPGNGSSGTKSPGNQGSRDGHRNPGGTHRSDNHHSNNGDRHFSGNSVNFHNRRIDLGHGSYRPAYDRHSGYHGYWNGNRGGGGRSGSSSGFGYGGGYGRYGGYGYRPFGWGLGGWGLGSLIYNSGYLRYSNPYYNNSYGAIGNYNYSQPVPVAYNNLPADAQNAADGADAFLNDAVDAFQQNDYDAALDITNHGLAQYPDDAVLHEFRALVLFARQDYQQATSTIHSVLAVGPGWDWATLRSLYSSVAVYTQQLRALEAFSKANPQDSAVRFLMAYHYMCCGHPDAAATQLRQVVKLTPNDRVAADLLKMLSSPQPEEPDQADPQSTPQPVQQPTTRPAANAINPAMLVGTWKAAHDDGSQFILILTNDAKFTWSFTPKGQAAQEFGGTYIIEGNTITLERTGGGSLVAEIAFSDDGKFNFKMVGAPTEDLGLDFSK